MSTGRGLLSASLRLITALAPGETLAASEAADGIETFNRMLSSWSTESLIIPNKTRESVALVPGTASYTMGTAGTYSSTRATRIVQALLRDETQSPASETPMKLLTFDEWTEITQKSASSAMPYAVFHDGANPLDVVYVYPVPTVAHKLVLYTEKPLTALTLDGEVALPPGYEEFIVYSGAIRLAPEYGKSVPAEVMAIAMKAEGNVKRANHRPSLMKIDAAILGTGAGTYNIYTGGSE